MIWILVKFLFIGYLIYKLFGLFVNFLVGKSTTDRPNGTYQKSQYQSRPTNGNVNIDYVPKDDRSEKSTKNFKGGEYVDYEEID